MRNISTLVFADTRKESRLKHIHPILEACKGFPKFPKVIVYDHHPPADDDITTEYLFYRFIYYFSLLIVRHIGSASSILTLEIMKRNSENPNSIQLSSEEATIIGLGIYQDTGCFVYNTTSKEDFQVFIYSFCFSF